ncbi:MAG: HIT family protein [Alphaproteobacteria bacterium]|nr:HIT family protein [Alphaproteobacteria bacterium]
MSFELLDTFKKKPLIAELPLSFVLMEEKEFPWILLIPRVNGALQITDLSSDNQIQLMKEISKSSQIMQKLFPCDRLNVAAIGNKTPQLHVHIICRAESDSLWPEVVWGRPMKTLSPEETAERAEILRKAFGTVN